MYKLERDVNQNVYLNNLVRKKDEIILNMKNRLSDTNNKLTNEIAKKKSIMLRLAELDSKLVAQVLENNGIEQHNTDLEVQLSEKNKNMQEIECSEILQHRIAELESQLKQKNIRLQFN